MNARRWFQRAVLAAGLCIAACGQKEVLPEPTAPELKAVGVSVQTVVLPTGGTETFSFSVKDPGYSFCYNPSDPNCDVALMGFGGARPSAFALVGVAPGEEPGSYTATLQDLGAETIFEQMVCIAVSQYNPITCQRSYVTSAYFTVRSELQKLPPGKEYLGTGLPVVYVNTVNGRGVYSKTEYVPASLNIQGIGSLEGLQTVSCSIRGRGNTTWSWPKKPYLIKLDEKAPIFGMHKHKRWILLANFMDRTLMRNLVSMKVSSMTSLAWTPGCQPVELVLNGKHLGSYLLIEQVRVDNHRVAITEMTPQDNAGDAVTGGYLLELDFHYDNEYQWKDKHGSCWQMGNAIPFAVKYPDPQDLTQQQKTYIKDYISEVAGTLYGSNFKDPEKGYAKYLDVDSFIDYWLVFEVMCNHELGNPGSVFMYKDRGGKLTAGPCWDFDWGVLSFNTSSGKTNLVNGKAIWYARLFEDPAFKARVKARFEALLPQLETIPDYMDQCEKMLEESARINFEMWNPAEDRSMNGGQIINGDEYLSFHDAVERLKSNYKIHLGIIKQKL